MTGTLPGARAGRTNRAREPYASPPRASGPSTAGQSGTRPRGDAGVPPESPADQRSTGFRAVTVSLGKHLKLGNRDVAGVVAVTVALVIYGIIMVLSSSSVEEYTSGNSVSDKFIKQTVFAAAGIPLMLLAARMPERFWRGVAWPAMIGAIALQALTLTPLGYEVNGNRAWIDVGGFTMQPAEAMKVALVLWLGYVVSRKEKAFGNWRHAMIPIVPMLVVAIGVSLLTKDLGTVMVLGVLVLGALFCGGFPMRYLTLGAVTTAGLAVLFAAISPNRVARITAFFSGDCDYENLCWQSTHGLYALAAGGFFGVGLGNSRAKWSWLPEADNDFIFAIIGEEFGLVGAIVLLAMFVLLAVFMVRLLVRTNDAFRRTVMGGVLVWLMFQAFVNIAVVLGLLPVLGVPLPLVSSGGSALVTTLLGIGIVVSMANAESSEPTSARRSRTPSRPRTTGRTAR